MITSDDVLLFFPTLLEIVLLAFVISRLITFIPSFMVAFVRKIRNKSIIYNDDLLSNGSLDPSLDKSNLGLKTLVERWFK